MYKDHVEGNYILYGWNVPRYINAMCINHVEVKCIWLKCTYIHVIYIDHVEVKYIWLKCTYLQVIYIDHVEVQKIHTYGWNNLVMHRGPGGRQHC
jgi:hypothetical protein